MTGKFWIWSQTSATEPFLVYNFVGQGSADSVFQQNPACFVDLRFRHGYTPSICNLNITLSSMHCWQAETVEQSNCWSWTERVRITAWVSFSVLFQNIHAAVIQNVLSLSAFKNNLFIFFASSPPPPPRSHFFPAIKVGMWLLKSRNITDFRAKPMPQHILAMFSHSSCKTSPAETSSLPQTVTLMAS